MSTETLVKTWFEKWQNGDFLNLPVADNFQHTSPFGTIKGKDTYMRLVKDNKDKFLDYNFEIHDAMYGEKNACVRYTAVQGDFNLDVSEWYYVKGDLIEEIVAYYHIGEIREERQLK